MRTILRFVWAGEVLSTRSGRLVRKKLSASIPEHSLAWGHAPSRIRWHGCTSDSDMLVASLQEWRFS